MEVPINKMLGPAGAPKLDVIRMSRCPGDGGVVFLFGEEGNSFPSSSDRHNPLTFCFYFTFFFKGKPALRAGFPSPLEWNSSPSLVAAVFNALYGGAPPGSGRIGVIGAHHWWHTKTSRSSLNTPEIAVTNYPRTSPQDCWHIRFSPSIPRTPIMDEGLSPRAKPAPATALCREHKADGD